MAPKALSNPLTVAALKVNQWLPSWNKVVFDDKQMQKEPKPRYFYLCSMKAGHLKALTQVYRRSTKGGRPRALDPNIQRALEQERASSIREYVQYGYPYCDLSSLKRQDPDSDDLRKPGWLPTAILVNILLPDSERGGLSVDSGDVIQVDDQGATAVLRMPESFIGAGWKAKRLPPLEVIDGQHRLGAFDGFDEGDDFEFPVVAFHGLDRGWQAYLFWSVNITPKKINRSLAFDLYPLLRQQSWLDKIEGHSIYRETRCQELVEALWSHPESPWHQRINMLGESVSQRDYKGPMVTQAAWVRSLIATFVKQWEGTGAKRIGGLFGAQSSPDQKTMIAWSRPMQAAVLIFAASALKKRIIATDSHWATDLRKLQVPGLFDSVEEDVAFYGDHSLLSTDQGIRGFLFVINDLCFVMSKELGLTEWRGDGIPVALEGEHPSATDQGLVAAAIKSFSKTTAARFIDSIAKGLATYDWRTSSTPGLPDKDRQRQLVFRGSSGYKEMRRQLLQHLAGQPGDVGVAANLVIKALGIR